MNSLKLTFWANKKYNVLFEGAHGTGKTASVKEIFTRIYGKVGVDWLYFSAATMDAWVDFVGVPREVVDEDGTRYLDLIRPRALAKGTVKAIFFDEFNRAPAKTRNAVMELLQFKSINGKRFENLDVIWAAINPDGDDIYDVERLDPAQEDRFDVKVIVPYDVNREYFFEKFGKMGEAACDWWRALDEEVKKTISPRRLETTVKMFNDGGDISDVLPVEGVNVQELIVQLQDGSYTNMLLHYLATKNVKAAKESLINENFYNGVEHEILNTSKHGTTYIEFFLPLMPNEKIAKIINSHIKARDWMVDKEEYTKYAHIFDSIIAINSTKEDRERNKIATSTISKLKQWKKRSGGSDLLTDLEYIDMASDSRMNIEFFKSVEERVLMLERFGRIMHSNDSLTKIDYTKILGPMVELYRYNDTDFVSVTPEGKYTLIEKNKENDYPNNIKIIDVVFAQMHRIGKVFEDKFNEKFWNVLDNTLPGLRSGGNITAFATTKTNMLKDGLVNEPV